MASSRPDGFMAMRRIPAVAMLEYLDRRAIVEPGRTLALDVWRAMDEQVIAFSKSEASPTRRGVAPPAGARRAAVGRSVVADEDFPDG